MNPPEWIKPGDFCRTRDGHKAEIYAVRRGHTSAFPVHGAIGDVMERWTITGSYSSPDKESNADLIGPWVEPEKKKPRLIAWIDRTYGGVVILGEDISYDQGYIRAHWLDEPLKCPHNGGYTPCESCKSDSE